MKIVKAHQVKRDLMHYAFYEKSHIAVVTEGANYGDVVSISQDREAFEFEVKTSRSDLNRELAAIKYASMVMQEGKNLAPADTSPEQAALNLELADLKKKSGGWSKISKHEEYIDPKKYLEDHKPYIGFFGRYIPNYFYMVVPSNLVAYTIEKLQNTKYGVIAFNGCRQEGQHYGRFFKGKWYDNYGDYPEGAEWIKGLPCSEEGCIFEIAVKKRPRKIHSDKISENVILNILNRACQENIQLLQKILALEASQ